MKVSEITFWHFLSSEPEQKIRTVKSIVNGQKHGVRKEFYRNGRLWSIQNWKHGELHGFVKSWRHTGAFHMLTYYKNGKTHGSYQEFHENGIAREEGNYVDDNLHGKIKMWNDTGDLTVEIHFHHGVLHGTHKQFRNKKLERFKMYHMGTITLDMHSVNFKNFKGIKKLNKRRWKQLCEGFPIDISSVFG